MAAKPNSLSDRVVKSGFWVFALRVANRGFGFLRKVLLARLLAPEDFGLFGIALLSISTLETFSRIGFQGALIQKKGDITSYLNTAWTAYVVRGILLCSVLYLSAPAIAEFFNSQQAVLIIRLVAISTLFQGFQNIGIIFFLKELEFRKQFVYEFTSTLINFIVAITLAFLFRSIFALVWGTLAGALARLGLSYYIHPYRPKLGFRKDKFKEILQFGSWTVISGILIFLVNQGDDIVVGKMLGTAALGFYQMAYMLSNLPTTEIAHVIHNVAFPAFSKLNHDLARLKKAYLRSLHLTAFLAFPVSIIIMIMAHDFTYLFLGTKWLEIVPIIEILVFAGLIRSIAATGGTLLFAIGKPKIDTGLQAIRFFLIAIFIYPFCLKWGAIGISWSILISISVPCAGFIFMTIKVLNCSINSIGKAIAFPLVNSILSMLCMIYIRSKLEVGLWQLLLVLIGGVLIYILASLIAEKFFSKKQYSFLEQGYRELVKKIA